MIICHSRRFTFVHIHKAGGTSIESALDLHMAWDDLILGSSKFGEAINAPYRTRHNLYKHSSVADIRQVCGARYLDEYYLFATVRHPVDRMCSFYNFIGTLLQRRKAHAERQNIPAAKLADAPMMKWAATKVFLATASFSEFIRQKDLEWDHAYHSQFSRLVCPVSGKIKAQIFKLEDIATGIVEMRNRLGIDLELLHENRSSALVDPKTVSPEDRRFLEELFSADYAAFGY